MRKLVRLPVQGNELVKVITTFSPRP